LDSFRLRNGSREEFDNLPGPTFLPKEIVVNLEAALEYFREIPSDLMPKENETGERSVGFRSRA